MDSEAFKQNVGKIQYQRNILTAFTFIVLLSNLLLVILLFWKKEKVIVAPPSIEKAFWVEGNQASPSYLEQFGLFIGQLILTKSPESVPIQNKLLLEHVDPQYTPQFRMALEKEKEEMLSKGITYLFFAEKVHLNPSKNILILEGSRVVYLQDKELQNEKQKYILQFGNHGGRLRLKEIRKEEIKR